MTKNIEENEAVRPTPERQAKGGLSQPPPDKRDRIAKPWHSLDRQIDHYHANKTINAAQYAAADKFWHLWTIAHGSDVKTQNWQGPISSSQSNPMADRAVAAWQQLNILASAASEDNYAVMRAVCGLGHSASGWARDAGKHPSIGLDRLRDALTWYARRLKIPDDK